MNDSCPEHKIPLTPARVCEKCLREDQDDIDRLTAENDRLMGNFLTLLKDSEAEASPLRKRIAELEAALQYVADMLPDTALSAEIHQNIKKFLPQRWDEEVKED